MQKFWTTCLVASALPFLSGCLTSGARNAPEPLSDRVAALRGSIAPTGSIKLSAGAEQRALQAQYQALQFGTVGQPVGWEADGFKGEITPTQLYRIGSQDCRGYTHVITRGTSKVRQVGSACRTSGDLWTPVA
ncbi:hypothetical protein D3218_08000 [Aureimonas flava]|uniref:Surface antigen domain-containing protein n=1 Tax=Aureimonas flava TaxID=2320271 RepID=A0A3A1WN60_9HYPH|nr:hypothetical protein [Aureimonas flava]RIY01303.1 hypothetical protein D3218_08000 [Aureimonas flava]